MANEKEHRYTDEETREVARATLGGLQDRSVRVSPATTRENCAACLFSRLASNAAISHPPLLCRNQYVAPIYVSETDVCMLWRPRAVPMTQRYVDSEETS